MNLRAGIFLFILSGWILQLDVASQLSHGGRPLPLMNQLKSEIPVIDVSQLPSRLNIHEEQPAFVNKKALIFAENHNVYITPEKDGTWVNHSSGYRIWILGIHSPGAASLGMIFSHYRLNKGTRVFVFNKNQSAIIGSLTSENNKYNGVLPVAHIPGDYIIIQLEVPENQVDYGNLEVGTIAHGYDYGDQANRLKDQYFGKSGDCNIDINCPAGDDFQVIKRSVCRIIISSSKRCTGNLINNTNQDGKPYVLTAAHCIGSQTEATSAIFLFNYESPVCNGPDVPAEDMISGSTLLATGDTLGDKANIDSLDFSLVELSVSPPDSFNVYFAGWNRDSDPSAYTATIHHPRGDVKKIAFDNDPPESSYHKEDYYPEYVLYSHWRILRWDSATTEFGSSGGALLDPQHRIIGLLTGGEAYCDNPVNDYFTRFDYSWDYYNDPLRSLKPWLDPAGTGVAALDGVEISTGLPAVDRQELMVWPNPGNGLYTIHIPQDAMEGIYLSIFDLTGKIVFKKYYESTNRIFIDITAQPSGVYILHGLGSGQLFTRKIIHQRYP